jgi:hypothetical protein
MGIAYDPSHGNWLYTRRQGKGQYVEVVDPLEVLQRLDEQEEPDYQCVSIMECEDKIIDL